ncbi:MAG: hypothetical protein OHK0053_03470 [Microscillaceae bacterium]
MALEWHFDLRKALGNVGRATKDINKLESAFLVRFYWIKVNFVEEGDFLSKAEEEKIPRMAKQQKHFTPGFGF